MYLEILKWMVRGCEPNLAKVSVEAEKKMSCAAAGKGNMSRVNLGLWFWD